jgi:EAL domain-containing protein (putative c-di-GMP-specific phosphodiesterase class I)
VAVNISPMQFRSRTLAQAVVHALAASGLQSSRLDLEITESAVLHDNEWTFATLHQLRLLGVRISMDDFGTGYSSLSCLRRFPFDHIKLDQSFLRDAAGRADCAAIVGAVASLGKALGITTIAEGVETAEQLERLRAEGYAEAQGYLFGSAVPADRVAWLLRKERVVPSVA